MSFLVPCPSVTLWRHARQSPWTPQLTKTSMNPDFLHSFGKYCMCFPAEAIFYFLNPCIIKASLKGTSPLHSYCSWALSASWFHVWCIRSLQHWRTVLPLCLLSFVFSLSLFSALFFLLMRSPSYTHNFTHSLTHSGVDPLKSNGVPSKITVFHWLIF